MMLSQEKARAILNKYKINSAKTLILKANEQLKSTQKISFPTVLKVDSPDVLHKTEMGLVFLGINSIIELKKKISDAKTILKNHNIQNYNLIIQESLKGIELIIGMKRDKTFGPVIVFGPGGVFVEIINDISMGIAPLKKTDCIDMLNGIKSKKLLEGYRNMPKANKEKLIDLLLKVSKLSMKEEDIVEIDFNPVIVNSENAVIADARIIKEEK